jgi:uncharacterized protein YjbI with pentapeptide repeats
MNDEVGKPEDQASDSAALRQIPQGELRKILDAHRRWIESFANLEPAEFAKALGKAKNEQLQRRRPFTADTAQMADLSNTDLQGADMAEENLMEACFDWADLRGANLQGAGLKGATFNRANLQGANLIRANLQRASLTYANLAGANLTGANLQGALMGGANLEGATLGAANLQGAYLELSILQGAFLVAANLSRATATRVSFQGANLVGANLQQTYFASANFERADLFNADFREADFSERIQTQDVAATIFKDYQTHAQATRHRLEFRGVRFAGARLDGATFLRADLTNAVLVGGQTQTEERGESELQAEGQVRKGGVPAKNHSLADPTIAGTNFGIANLTGAKLPDFLNEFRDALKNVEETSRNARTIYFTLLALCAFTLLTVATTTDVQLVLDNFRLRLPILGADVTVALFYVSAPIVGLLVFAYLHLYLAHLWELASELPAVFPDGLPLRRKLYPWMLNLVIEVWQREKGQTGWEDVGWRARFRIDSLRETVRTWARLDQLRAWTAIFLGWGLLPLTIGAVGYRYLVRHDTTLSYLLLGALSISVLFASSFYQHARSTARDENIGRRWTIPMLLTAITLSTGIYVTERGLEGQLWSTTAILDRADLSQANLVEARLEGANLAKATLLGANLYRAHLEGAILSEADLERADLQGATGLSASQIKAAKNWEMAFYDRGFLEVLGLPPDHNEELEKRLIELEQK